jgi:erythromycin esterase-like protein
LEREGYCRALFDDYKSSSVPILVKKEFDGLVFIDKTTRAIPIKRK